MNELTPDGGSDLAEDRHTFRFSRAQSFFDRSAAIRLLLGIIFVVLLFLFLHFRESYVETLELGTEAKRYVVSQIDFAFPDEEATIILKQEAAHEIGLIYRIEEEDVRQKINQFQKYIAQGGQGVEKWEELTKETNFDNSPLLISLISDALSQSRFVSHKTSLKIKSFPPEALTLSPQWFYPYLPLYESSRLPPQFWSYLTKIAFKEIPPAIAAFTSEFLELILWHFEEDQGIEYTLRKLAQSEVPQLYTRVRAGERLIDQGEKVTGRHLAMLSAMKEKLNKQRNLLDPFTIGGSLLLSLIFVVVGAIYLQAHHKDIFYSNQKLSLLMSVLILSLGLAKIVEIFLIKNTSNLVDLVRFPLFVPIAAILLSSLINSRIAAFAAIFLTLVDVLALAVEPVPFVIVNILTAMVAILSVHGIRRRKEVFAVCAKAWIASLIIILAFNLYENTAFTSSFFSDVISTLLFMTLTAILVVGLLPLFESVFQIMTDITLMEFMDPNNELLKKLAIVAPGTYQHSMLVGLLAEAAASAIGANGLFCRVATHYHDIGKLTNPQYFTENQLGGVDMHQLLTPLESAQVIISHVSEGVALARKAGLPEQFIDIIKEHHGTTLVYYFFHKQVELMGHKKVEEKDFRYSGPKPRSRESTIIMIADTLEAASRSLDNNTEEAVSQLVETLIAQKMTDGQFDESHLTFEELGQIKETLVKTLIAVSHPRIKYPTHQIEVTG